MAKKLDTNKDGKIDLPEWQAAGGTVEEFRQLDANQDGALDQAEIEAAVARGWQPSGPMEQAWSAEADGEQL